MRTLLRLLAVLLLTASPVLAQQGASRGPEPFPQNGRFPLRMLGMGRASITVSGTFTSGTILFKGRGNPNAEAVDIPCTVPSLPNTIVSSTTTTGTWICDVGGLTQIELVASAVVGPPILYLAASPGGGGGSAAVSLEGDIAIENVGITSFSGSSTGISGAGEIGAGTQRITIATDDVVSTALAELAGAISTELQVDIVGGLPTTAATTALAIRCVNTAGNAFEACGGSGGGGGGEVTNAGTFAVQVDGAALTALELIDNAVSGAGFNITQFGGAAIPMTTTQADNISLAQDGLNVTAFTYVHDGTNLDLLRVGTAGSAAAQVHSVQGISGMTPLQMQSNNADLATQTTLASALTALQLIDNAVGPIAAGTAATASFAVGGVYNATPPTLTSGQQAALQFASDARLLVDADCSNCTGSGVSADDGDDFTAGDPFAPIGGLYDATPGALTDGDKALVGLTEFRAMRVSLELADGTPLEPNDQTESELFGSTGPGMFGRRDDALATLSAAEGEAAPLHLNSVGALWAVDVNSAALLTSNQLQDDVVISHDSPDTAPTTGIGYRAIAFGTNPTAVAAADRTVGYASRAGVPFVMGGHPNIITAEAQVEDGDGAQTNAALVTCGAGCKVVVTRLKMSCDASTTGATNAVIGFAAATLPARAHTGVSGILAAFDGIPPGGGAVEGGGGGILGVGADGEDLRLTMEDPVGGSCNVSYSYYTVDS